MNLQREFERRIEKKEQEVAELQKQLSVATAALETLKDTAKWVLPKAPDKETVLRMGSDLAKAQDLIKKHGKPLHVSDILRGIGKEVNKGNRISISGSLGSYARKGIIFSKPAPNTFGLIELETANVPEVTNDEIAAFLETKP